MNSVLCVRFFFKVFMVRKNVCKGRNDFYSVVLICVRGAQTNTEWYFLIVLTSENN